MAGAEIDLEGLYYGHEATRGGALTNPTHKLNLRGTLMPHQEVYRPPDNLASFAEVGRAEVVRRWATVDADGALDNFTLPLLLNGIFKPFSTFVTPGGATNARTIEFIRNLLTDDIKSGKFWWGDPNSQMYRGDYAMFDELRINADATGTDGTTMGVTATTQEELAVANPTLPSTILSPLFVPKKMQLWLDTSLAIGTTEIQATLLTASHTFPTGVTYKYPSSGPAGGVTYTRTGRKKTHPETKISLDLLTQAQYNLYKNKDIVKCRVRHNGPLIEGALYHYVEVDMYGIFDSPGWGEFESSNRTLEFTIIGQVDPTLGSDARIGIQTTKTTL